MTPPLELLDGNTLVLSNTRLSVIKTCPAMFKWNYLYGRVRAGAVPARDAGKAFDAALNVRYRELGSGPVAPGSDVEARMLAEIDKGFAGLEIAEDEPRNHAQMRDTVRLYNEARGREPFKVLAVQMPLAVPIGTISVPSCAGPHHRDDHVNVILHGILDLLVEADDGAWVVDTKTTGRWGAQQSASYENSSQAKGYCWMVQEAARLHPELGLSPHVKGFMVNAVVIKPPVKTKRRDGSPDTEFVRERYYYAQERLEEWRRDTLAWCRMMMGWCDADHFPENDKACAFHFGRKCPYLEVCQAPASQREMVLGMDVYKDYEKGPLGEQAGAVEEDVA